MSEDRLPRRDLHWKFNAKRHLESPCKHIDVVLCYALEMCGNGFQYSHSLPFPSIQFPFPPTPIPKFLTYSHSHGIPVWAIPIPSHSNSHLGLVIGLALACETTQSSLEPVLLQ